MRVMPRQRETRVQAAVVQLCRSVGGVVYVLGRPPLASDVHKGTRQTPGVPDLCVHLPVSALTACPAHQLWCEVKARGGRLSEAQKGFRDFCLMAGIPHLVGGVDEVAAYLTERGYLR